MTVSIATPGTGPARRLPLASDDKLVSFPDAARCLGRSPDTLRRWADAGHLPAVTTPGGQLSTFQSFIDDVLSSARPGRPGVIEDVCRGWFARRGIASEAVA